VASKYICRCGAVVRTNLFEGHGLSLLVSEGLFDGPNVDSQPASTLVDVLIRDSRVVARCAACGTLSVVDSDGRVKFFAQVDEAVARDAT
jgi:hypothetical protein